MTNTPEGIAGQQPTIDAMESVRGKQIKDFSLKTIPGSMDAHQTEQLTIFFTDGSSLVIDSGSNALNLSRPGLDSSDFHVDLFASLVPPSPRGSYAIPHIT